MGQARIRGAFVLLVAIAVLAVIVGGPQGEVVPISTSPDERVILTVRDDGDELGTIDAMVADDYGEKYTGLSDTDTLAPSEGMVFVYGDTAHRAFVMRDMAFPLDIIFVDGNGTIVGIEEAAADDDGRFTGTARWVIEVNRGYTAAHEIEVGHRVEGLPGK